MKSLRIATFITGHISLPQPKGAIYVPIDLAVALAAELTRRGHEVSFFAPEGSQTPGSTLVTHNLPPLRQGEWHSMLLHAPADKKGAIETLWEQYLLAHMFRIAEEKRFDIVHVHPIDMALPLGLSHSSVPTVYTLHDPISQWRKSLYTLFSSPNQHLVSITNAQRAPAPNLNFIDTVYNGIYLDEFPFSNHSGKHLLVVGRLIPNKGIAEAIAVAQATHQKLLIVGPISENEKEYFEKEIKPHLNEDIVHIGFVERKELYHYYQDAIALLMPIQWEEPFGLVMTESMACGTPVIAFRRGSVPELVADGETGFIVDSIDQMIDAVGNIDSISRKACRAHVEKNFSMEQMVNGYEQAYYRILERA